MVYCRGTKKVVAFIPVEHRKTEWIINNYYAHADYIETALPALIESVAEEQGNTDHIILSAVVQSKHLPLFTQEGFEITKSWKNYHKKQKVI